MNWPEIIVTNLLTRKVPANDYPAKLLEQVIVDIS